MDNRSLSGGIRRFAFQKLAALAVEAPRDGGELTRLTEQSQSTRQPDGALNGVLREQAPASQIPMVCLSIPTPKL
jgi:phosphatidylinositol 4-kinase